MLVFVEWVDALDWNKISYTKAKQAGGDLSKIFMMQ